MQLCLKSGPNTEQDYDIEKWTALTLVKLPVLVWKGRVFNQHLYFLDLKDNTIFLYFKSALNTFIMNRIENKERFVPHKTSYKCAAHICVENIFQTIG